MFILYKKESVIPLRLILFTGLLLMFLIPYTSLPRGTFIAWRWMWTVYCNIHYEFFPKHFLISHLSTRMYFEIAKTWTGMPSNKLSAALLPMLAKSVINSGQINMHAWHYAGSFLIHWNIHFPCMAFPTAYCLSLKRLYSPVILFCGTISGVVVPNVFVTAFSQQYNNVLFLVHLQDC